VALVLTNTTTKAQLPLLGVVRSRAAVWRRRVGIAATGALAMMMGYGVIFGHNGVTSFMHKREEARTLQLQMQQLQVENARLQEHVQRLQNDPDAIEYEAREDLHYARPGEVIVSLPVAPKAAEQAEPADQR
jgi:cell division protein FtsB